jgi:hypothetical protein
LLNGRLRQGTAGDPSSKYLTASFSEQLVLKTSIGTRSRRNLRGGETKNCAPEPTAACDIRTALAVFLANKTKPQMTAWNALPEAERLAKQKERCIGPTGSTDLTEMLQPRDRPRQGVRCLAEIVRRRRKSVHSASLRAALRWFKTRARII